MIQMADIGIGISGQEGMQAVMASDFAIARFQYLERLLLVHGHWCYSRMARFSTFMFYKSLVSPLSYYSRYINVTDMFFFLRDVLGRVAKVVDYKSLARVRMSTNI